MSTRTAPPIEPSLRHNQLAFGDVCIEFQRTLRIPDDGREYPLPPGLGTFPVLPVSRFADRVPDEWRRRGGVFIPMHQREALWIRFSLTDWESRAAVKVGIGKVNAVTGDPWTDRLQAARNGRKQDYVVLPDQPWLDGINVGDGRIRQFVAVPLGSGYTVGGPGHGRGDVGRHPAACRAWEAQPATADGVPNGLRADAPGGVGHGDGCRRSHAPAHLRG